MRGAIKGAVARRGTGQRKCSGDGPMIVVWVVEDEPFTKVMVWRGVESPVNVLLSRANRLRRLFLLMLSFLQTR